MAPEPWLRGPVEGVDPYLMPAAHALQQSREDLARAAEGLTADQLWARPGGAASVGFHLRHVAFSIDRLLTYARGEALSDAQRNAAASEAVVGPEREPGALVAAAAAAIETALGQIRSTPRASLLEPRAVGRAGLPSTVLGLLFHVAEHTQRHTGQVIATAKAVRGESR
jgi:uncharacterized damage-inducible protein DinB